MEEIWLLHNINIYCWTIFHLHSGVWRRWIQRKVYPKHFNNLFGVGIYNNDFTSYIALRRHLREIDINE